MKKYSLHSHPGRPGDNKKDGGSDSIIYQGHHGLHHAVEGNNAEQDANHTLSQSYRPQRQNFFNLHITAIRDCVVTPERVHIVMAAAKCNLADYIASKRRLCEPEARRLFRQLIQAVCYCHAKAVVHRDLKLENVLISNDGATLELADFGLSKFVDPNNFLCSSVCGTPKYIAPEVILRRRYDGRKSDVWACGVILFAMLNGRLPFHAFKLKTLRSWVAFVEIASKMSKRRYKSLVQAQFVTVDSDAKKNSKTQRSKTSRDDSQKEIEHDGQRERTLVCSVAAEQLISSMLRFSPEDRTDTDEITFHEWMHPDEGTEEYNEDEIITTQLFPDSTVESNKRAQTKQQVMRKSTDKYQDSSHNSKIGESGALLRTRRAEARNAPIWASDSTASACTNCHKKFSIFRRRHHCRCCGLIFCHPCAIKRDLKDLPVHLRGFVPVRCPRDYEAGEDTELDVKFLRICDICIATNPR